MCSIVRSQFNRRHFVAAAVEVFADVSAAPPLPLPCSPPGSRAEQARGGPASHPEPVWNLTQRQQERQCHAAGPLRSLVSGVLLAAGEEQKPTQCYRWEAFAVGTPLPPLAFWGRWDQRSQEAKAGAGQRENQEPARVSEEEQRARQELTLLRRFSWTPLLLLCLLFLPSRVGLLTGASETAAPLQSYKL